MSDQSPLPLSVGGPLPGADPVFTISGPARAGIGAAMLPNGFAPLGPPPVFTITDPAHEDRMRALEQRCAELQLQIARLARS